MNSSSELYLTLCTKNIICWARVTNMAVTSSFSASVTSHRRCTDVVCYLTNNCVYNV
jgi:hypothetical protein